jgi:hypothetical protein
MPPSLLVDGMGAGYFDMNGLSGGERVRLCNPCVPDPNTAPPESPTPSIGSPRPSHHRSRSSLGGSHVTIHPSNRYGAVFTGGDSRDPLQYHYARARSITMVGFPSFLRPPYPDKTCANSLVLHRIHRSKVHQRWRRRATT